MMSNTKNDIHKQKEPGTWALFIFVSTMIPIILNPGNLGPIAIVVGTISFAIPYTCIGYVTGLMIGFKKWPYRLLLLVICVGVIVYVTWFAATH